MSKAGKKIIAALKEALSVARGETKSASVWMVDRDGRVRKDTDRPVVLRAAK